MQLTSQSFSDGQPIPGEFAFCVPAAEGHVALSSNRNPQLAWSGAPAGGESEVGFEAVFHVGAWKSPGGHGAIPGRAFGVGGRAAE